MLHDQFMSLPLPPTIMKVKLVSARQISSISAPFASCQAEHCRLQAVIICQDLCLRRQKRIFQNHRLIVFSRLFRYMLFTQY